MFHKKVVTHTHKYSVSGSVTVRYPSFSFYIKLMIITMKKRKINIEKIWDITKNI